jgi:hypothetical protein
VSELTRRSVGLACGLSLLLGCASTPEAAKPELSKAPVLPEQKDESRRFPAVNRKSVELSKGPLLGMDFLPPGNVATYTKGKQSWRLICMKAASADKASIVLFDLKAQLRDAKFVASFGGYFGMNGDEALFLFQKNDFVLGVAGLPQADADREAREFAARF